MFSYKIHRWHVLMQNTPQASFHIKHIAGTFSALLIYDFTLSSFILTHRVILLYGGYIMFRVWGRIFKDNKMLKDTVAIIEDSAMTRTHKVFAALDQICIELDLSKPIWLESNIDEFKKIGRTRFTKDSFIEQIDFDYLDFYIIEED